MLALDSPRWQTMWHAYGMADDIPVLLTQLETSRMRSCPPEEERSIWQPIWERLEHQMTVYEASYAAVPHLVRIASLSTSDPHECYFSLPTLIEVRRCLGYGEPLPDEIAPAYHQAIHHLPQLACRFMHLPWNEGLARGVAAAIAAAKGHILLADVFLELRPEMVEGFYQSQGWTYHHAYLNEHRPTGGNS